MTDEPTGSVAPAEKRAPAPSRARSTSSSTKTSGPSSTTSKAKSASTKRSSAISLPSAGSLEPGAAAPKSGGAGGSGSGSGSGGGNRRRRGRRGGRGRSRPAGTGSATAESGESTSSDEAADSTTEKKPASSRSGSSRSGSRSGSGSGSSSRSGGGTRTRSTSSRSGSGSTDKDAGAEAEGGETRAPRQRRASTRPKTTDDASASEGSTDGGDAKPAPRKRRAPAKPRTGAGAATEVADEGTDTETSSEDSDGAPRTGTGRRRGRRGGRGRNKPKPEGDESDAAESKDGDAKDGEVKKRAPRKRATTKTTEKKDGDKKAPAKRKKKEPEQASTRIRAKGRAARESRMGRTSSARRKRETLPPIIRVENKTMVITENGDRDQIAVLEERALVEHYITRVGAHSMVGNIYKARVQNVLPGMEAAFLDVGRGRNGVLYAGEVNYDEEVEGQPRIEKALKNGQSLMVQVTKEPIGTKGARLTAQITLPGRYLVIAPNSEVFGISRRLPDDERKRLRTIIKKAKPDGYGVIVRTAAEGASAEEIEADIARLVIEWEEIEKKAKKAKAPSALYEEPELTVRVVRDVFNAEEFKELVTDSPSLFERVTEYLTRVAPELLERVKLHTGPLPVFEEYHIVEEIHKALDRKVWLPSGGYLIIERTEAMTVIDVNTGKAVGKSNLEDTVVNTNIEAAAEVARQLRLRDIGGMIIIDFIDMLMQANKRQVIDTLSDALAQDKTRSQVFDISPLGLMEVTRKRVSAGLLESFSETCPTCEGRGIILTLDT